MLGSTASSDVPYDIQYAERIHSMPTVLYNHLPVLTALRTSVPQYFREPLARHALNRSASFISFAFDDAATGRGSQEINLEQYPERIKTLQGKESGRVGLAFI